MLCFGLHLLTVVCADVFCIPDIYIYVFIVVIFYFFLEPALMGLCPSGFQPPMANKHVCKFDNFSRFGFHHHHHHHHHKCLVPGLQQTGSAWQYTSQ